MHVLFFSSIVRRSSTIADGYVRKRTAHGPAIMACLKSPATPYHHRNKTVYETPKIFRRSVGQGGTSLAILWSTVKISFAK
jgi:hypothetical protein